MLQLNSTRHHRRFCGWATRAAVFLSLSSAVTSLQAADPPDHGIRLKDLVSIEGVRENQLIGYGLVVGLNGTGDRQQTLFPAQSLVNLLQRMGVSMPPGSITVKNTASVLVTATLPPYGQPGSQVDATVGAIGDATNLQGGLLVLTTLRGVNGQVYATVQGHGRDGRFRRRTKQQLNDSQSSNCRAYSKWCHTRKSCSFRADWKRGQTAIERSRF